MQYITLGNFLSRLGPKIVTRPGLVSMETKNDNGLKQLKDQNPDNNAPTLLANQENEAEEQDLSAKPELPNIDMRDSIASELLQIDNRDKGNENMESNFFGSLPFLENSMGKRRKDSKKYLVAKFPEIALNEGGNLKEESLPQIPSSFPTDRLQFIESKEDKNWHFLRDARSPRSGSPVGSPGSPTPSVYYDALGDGDEDWKVTGGSLVGAGLGINLGQRHDESTKRHQHDMLVRTQDSNSKLQKELEECQKKIMIAEQQAAENKRKLTEWQVSKEQYYKEEIQRINDEHVLELSAQKEALQKGIKIEIGLEKGQLTQEFSSKISQEVTKACKKQELRIKQLNRTIRNLRGEKQGQEMDMEAYREKIAGQGEELLEAERRALELRHRLDARNQEVERLHAKIGNLEKRSIEAQSLAEQTAKELQKSKRELEASQTKADYAQDSTPDGKTASESESSVRHWNSGRRTAEPKNRELELARLSEKLANGKAEIESQSCQINLLGEKIAKLTKAHEEDDTRIKVQRRKIQSLEGLPQSLVALSERFDKLKDQFHNLNRTEKQGRATIKQLQNEIDEFVSTRAELKEAHESLIAKETDLNETMIKLQHHEVVIKQQQKEIDELMIAKTKLKDVQEYLDAKETELNETMIKLERKESIIEQQQKEIDKLLITVIKLKEVQDSLDAKQADSDETIIKLERNESILKQQQKEIDKLLITGIKLKEVQESLDAKQIMLNETVIKLEHDESIIKQQREEIGELVVTKIKLKLVQESLDSMKSKLNETMIKQEHDEAIIKQQRKEINKLVVTRARLKEAQESVDSKQAELNETMIKLERDKAIIKQQQGEIQELSMTRARLKKLQGSLDAKHIYLEKTMIELAQANQELQNLLRQQKEKADAKLEESLKSSQARPALAARSINSERIAGATSSYFDKQNPLPNIGESGHRLAIPNINNSATSAIHETKLFGAEDISGEIEEDHYNYYDDGHESLHDILRRAVAGGAAILRKLEMMPIGVVIPPRAVGWEDLGNS